MRLTVAMTLSEGPSSPLTAAAALLLPEAVKPVLSFLRRDGDNASFGSALLRHKRFALIEGMHFVCMASPGSRSASGNM
jgi:hypothetical protein